MKPRPKKSMQDGHPVSFVKSEPDGEDLFEGQAQERIAKSIAQLIKSNQTKDKAENKLIGLDGAWGSGKSNLVEILKTKLKATHHFFVYDAWGHQEDLQRRSFLEELVTDLCMNNIISGSWQEKLRDVLSRQSETVTQTTPHFGYGAIITMVVIVTTPIFNAMAEIVTSSLGKFVITIIPFLAGGVIYCQASRKAGRYLSLPDLYSIYKEEELSNKSQTTIFEKEPSVTEFQNWMNNLSRALTDERKEQSLVNKKLIIVFDNMDRLPLDKVRELWSSIHTFFAEASYKGIWVIVPFDRKQISTVFENEITHEGKKEGVSDEFLKKSFSIIYRVAPPVLTDWGNFFDLKYSEAFGKSEKSEQRHVRQVFDRFQKKITPRNIITFINEMVSLRLIVEKEIQLRYIAVFVLAKKKILKVPIVDQIIKQDYLAEAKSLFIGDEDLPDNIAALAYQVPLALASQVTLTREIQNSFNSRNGQRLNSLAHHRHFINILEQVIAEDNLDIDNAVATISMLDSNIVRPHKLTYSWNHLCSRETKRSFPKQKFTETHELLLTRCSPNRRVSLAKHLVNEIQNTEDFRGSMYYQALSDLHGCIQDNNLRIGLLRMVSKIRKSPDIFVDYVGAAKNEYKKFKLECEESGLLTYVINKIPDDLNGLSILSVASDDYNFAPVFERLEEELTNNSLTIQNVGPFYELYKTLAEEKPIRVIESDRAIDLLSQAKTGSEAQYDLLAMCLAQGLSQSVFTDLDEDQINLIATRIEYYGDYGDMLVNNLDWGDPLLRAILTEITLHPYGISKLNIVDTLSRYSDLTSSLDVEPLDLIARLNDWNEYAREEITESNIVDCAASYKLFLHATQVECGLSRHLIETMASRLNSLGIGEWLEAFQDRTSFVYKVAHLLTDRGYLQRVPSKAVPAYRQLLLGIARDEFTMTRDVLYHIFSKKMYAATLKSVAKEIRDIYISEEEITPEKFLFFAELLIRYGSLNHRSDEVVQSILAPVGNDDRCLTLIADNSGTFAQIINNAGKGAIHFKNIARRKFSPVKGTDKKWGHLAKVIKIKRKRP